MQGKQVRVDVRFKFDPTVEDSKDAGAYPRVAEVPPILLSYQLAAGANRLVESDISAAVLGTNDDLSTLTAVDVYCVHNPVESANYVDVAWDSVEGTSNVCRVSPGETFLVSDLDKATAVVLTANTAAVTVKRWYVGY
jgi:hypothetical protein